MMNFQNLEQRMAHTYLETLPPFVPLPGGPVSVQSQEQFYTFMKSVFLAYHDTPEKFFTTLHEDDAFPNRYNKSAYGKPRLNTDMKKILAEIEGMVTLLLEIGRESTLDGAQLVIGEGVTIKKKQLASLACFGLHLEKRALWHESFDELFSAWIFLATRPGATPFIFSRCMFDPAHSYMQDIYSQLFGSQQLFGELMGFLEQHGYQRFDLTRGPFTFDYLKNAGNGEVMPGNPLYGDKLNYGISAEYSPQIAIPQSMVLRVIEMKGLLQDFEKMPERVKGFTIKRVKKCDNCGYCTQTDKTGKRKKLSIEVHHGQTYELCPLFPGYSFTFTQLDEQISASLIAFLDYMDTEFTARQPA